MGRICGKDEFKARNNRANDYESIMDENDKSTCTQRGKLEKASLDDEMYERVDSKYELMRYGISNKY